MWGDAGIISARENAQEVPQVFAIAALAIASSIAQYFEVFVVFTIHWCNIMPCGERLDVQKTEVCISTSIFAQGVELDHHTFAIFPGREPTYDWQEAGLMPLRRLNQNWMRRGQLFNRHEQFFPHSTVSAPASGDIFISFRASVASFDNLPVNSVNSDSSV